MFQNIELKNIFNNLLMRIMKMNYFIKSICYIYIIKMEIFFRKIAKQIQSATISILSK